MISDTLLSKFWHGSGFDSGVPISERDISIVPAPGGRWGIVHGLRVKPFDAYPSKDDAVVKGRELARESRGFLFILNGEAQAREHRRFLQIGIRRTAMTDPRNVWVLPHPYKGGWAIKREGAETFLDRYKSVARAIDSAREVARTLGGMLIVENEAGIITCENPGQPQLQHS